MVDAALQFAVWVCWPALGCVGLPAEEDVERFERIMRAYDAALGDRDPRTLSMGEVV